MLKSKEIEERICEALKFLMLCKSIQMYNRMGDGEDVPVFCTVLFARSTSQHPYHFMINHLNILGLDSRLKQWALICNLEPQHARERVCEIMLKSKEIEERICEALKFLMLCKSIQMYNRMGDGEDVPVFCTLLFARSTSHHPYHFMINHLNILGLDSRLKQMEVELLLYTLFS
ncbi:UNVERIFIED_CONTAM: hypothetical protein FKN15_009449 [Acipenser sinensis]